MLRASEDVKKDVVDQLYWDSRVDASDISVTVNDGSVVLKGKLPTFRQRTAAEEDALVVPGVRQVDNEVEVSYATARPEPPALESHIRNVLEWDPDIDARDLTVIEQDGQVTLRGSVDSLWKKLEAEDIVLDIFGVLSVTNELVVTPLKSITDQVIGEDIVGAISRNVLLNVDLVDVRVENGVVTLSGTVPNWTARREALAAARYTPGVIAVNDRLIVA